MDFTSLKELNQARINLHKTDDFINRTIFLYARTIILNGLSLTSEIKKNEKILVIIEMKMAILNSVKFQQKIILKLDERTIRRKSVRSY